MQIPNVFGWKRMRIWPVELGQMTNESSIAMFLCHCCQPSHSASLVRLTRPPHSSVSDLTCDEDLHNRDGCL